MASFKTRPGGILAVIRIKGFPHTSKVHRTMGQAKKWAQRVESEMRVGVYEDSSRVFLSDVFDWYRDNIVPEKKSPRFHLMNLRTLSKVFKNTKLEDFNAAKVVLYVKGRDVSPSTKLKEINTLNTAIDNYCAFHDLPYASPIPKAKILLRHSQTLRAPRPNFRRLADGEYDRLMSHLDGEFKMMAELTLQTGRRLKELLQIGGDTLYVLDGKLHLEVLDNKTDQPINVELPDSVKELLEGFEGFTQHPNTYTHHLAKANKAAGLRGITLTKLRKEAYSRMFAAGKSLPQVMAISGHSTPDMLLKVYASVELHS